ncbi:hypothetical protein ACSSWA_01490 [Melioribacter sp. Ez-97]|uniref:hypothetical protein n=1 Tax=unclassified Melioribacter TaxID=2627329 RepID=UPI003ED9CA94
MMRVSPETIERDLKELQEAHGSDFIRTLCAAVIYEYCWWNWRQMKDGITNDPDFIELINKRNGHEKEQSIES